MEYTTIKLKNITIDSTIDELVEAIIKAIPEKETKDLYALSNQEDFTGIGNLGRYYAEGISYDFLRNVEIKPHNIVIGILAEWVPADQVSIMVKYKTFFQMTHNALNWTFVELRKRVAETLIKKALSNANK